MSSMGRRRVWIPENRSLISGHFIREKSRIEASYPCFHCVLHGNRLTCVGAIQPGQDCETYEIKIDYRMDDPPQVRITRPDITPSTEYHMYSDGQLCLYDHRSSPWKWRYNIHETIIPWTAEWLVFYELWRITGEWLGPAAPHGPGLKKPEEPSLAA